MNKENILRSDLFLDMLKELENGNASKEEVLQMTLNEIEKVERRRKVEEIHKHTIRLDKKGYWTTKLPNGYNKKSKQKDLLYDKLYVYYFGYEDYTFKAIFEKAITANQRITESTKMRKRQSYNQFISDEFGQKDIRTLNFQAIDDYVINVLKSYEKEYGKKMLKSTFGNLKSVINCVLKYCNDPRHPITLDKSLVAINSLNVDYSRFYALPIKNSKNAIRKAYQPSDVKQLTDELTKRVKANRNYIEVINALAILCSANSGMRIAELCALKWSDIDNDTINIHSQIVKVGNNWLYEASTKDEKYCSAGGREFPLSNHLKEIFERTKHYQNVWNIKTDYVFGRSDTWSNPSQIAHALAKISKKLKLTCTNNHALRMYFNSYVLALKGIEPSTRAYLLGHSVQVNLDVYTLPLNGNDLCHNVLLKLNNEQVTQKDSLVTQQKTA